MDKIKVLLSMCKWHLLEVIRMDPKIWARQVSSIPFLLFQGTVFPSIFSLSFRTIIVEAWLLTGNKKSTKYFLQGTTPSSKMEQDKTLKEDGRLP